MSYLRTAASEERVKSSIIENVQVAPRIMRITLHAPEVARTAQPGQFVHLLCSESGSFDPLLRRPISIHNVRRDSGKVILMYEVRGRGTDLLSRMTEGDTVDLLGPLGNGFDLPKSSHAKTLVVGGGMGVAPLVFLADELVKRVGCENVHVHVGYRTESALICRDDFELMDASVRAATEDGSYGATGYVTALVSEYLDEIDSEDTPTVYACGPVPMLRAVSKIVCERGFTCLVSLEAKMACGIGACMGCAVKVKPDEYVRVCKEGPVFNADEVVWD
jgi:dihydroorotate dehydrogenase electron transfer subunit